MRRLSITDGLPEGIDNLDNIRQGLINWRNVLLGHFPDEIAHTLLLSHAIWWLSKFQEVIEAQEEEPPSKTITSTMCDVCGNNVVVDDDLKFVQHDMNGIWPSDEEMCPGSGTSI